MIAGWIQEQLGYLYFFVYVMLCSVVPIVAASRIKIE
jgi:PAT family beta-lactamase induction signal transducer AmpG